MADLDPLPERLANYVITHNRWEALSKREVAIETVSLIINDIGAAQEVLDAVLDGSGITIDLYHLSPGARYSARPEDRSGSGLPERGGSLRGPAGVATPTGVTNGPGPLHDRYTEPEDG